MAKTFLSYQDQISQLQSEKQLLIPNPAYAENMLEKLSYYTLIGGYKDLFEKSCIREISPWSHI